MAPVINFEGCIAHRHAFHAMLQLFEEHFSAFIEIFVVNTNWQHEMEKFAVGNSLSPIHLCACTQCVVNIHLVEIYRVIGCIGNWHISIQELHGKFCIACQTQIFYRCKNIRHRAVGLSCLKILLNSVVNRCCRSKNCKQHYGNHAKSFFYHICNKRLYFWFYHKVKKYLLILTYISPISFIRNSLQKPPFS